VTAGLRAWNGWLIKRRGVNPFEGAAELNWHMGSAKATLKRNADPSAYELVPITISERAIKPPRVGNKPNPQRDISLRPVAKKKKSANPVRRQAAAASGVSPDPAPGKPEDV
jgi:hypothetical protein